MPNIVAYATLLIWPIISVLLFSQIHPARALTWTMLGGYLLLPVDTGFKFSGVPILDKTSIPNITSLLCCAVFARERWKLFPRDGVVVALCIVFLFSPFFTSLNNTAPIIRESGFLPPMTSYDALAQMVANAIILIPFLLGYALFNTEKRRWWLLQALLMAGLYYSVLMLIEVRLSPQLHFWVYGFFPSSFAQQMRAGGFRPAVFLGHGLLVATFCAMSLTAGIALWRQRKPTWGMQPAFPVVYLCVLLVLCKTAGALILATIIGGAVAFLKPGRVALISALLCVVVLVYPLPRAFGLIPVATISNIAGSVSNDRQGSFQTRVTNENFLLERSSQKPIFGWGTWGRNRTAYEDTGIATITDGTWIITLGTWGWAGYIASFGLLSIASLRALKRNRRLNDITMTDAALFGILAINMLDLIPNSSLRPLTWLIAGALCCVRQEKIGETALRRANQPAPSGAMRDIAA